VAALIHFALANRLLVVGFLLAVTGYGLYCLAEIPIEAFPDLTNNQVSVITECPAMAAAAAIKGHLADVRDIIK